MMRFHGAINIDSKKIKRTFKMMGRLILNLLRVLRRIRVSFDEIFQKPVFPTHPYMLPYCKKFFLDIKVGNLKLVKDRLEADRMYIFQVDSVRHFR